MNKVQVPPADAQWVWTTAGQTYAEFAVAEQNKRPNWDLTFNTVSGSWNMTLATDYGNLYLLHLKALRNNILVDYQAIVWVQPRGSVPGGSDPKTLVSFKELPSTTTA